MREIVPEVKAIGKKLENYLKKEFPIGYVRKLFRKNGIRLNGQRAKPHDTLGAGDKIQLYIPFEKTIKNQPSAPGQKLDLVFQDENLLVIDKPAGMAVHEGKTVTKRESVLGILEQQYRGTQVKPLLVHRLDQDTSGILLVAKNPQTADELERAFETGESIDKEYLALVIGRLAHSQGKIDTPLPGREGNPVRALTRYWVIKRYSNVTLVRVAIETGRLHQIRLHFAQLGHPVVMDDQHGDFAFNKDFRRDFGLKRQFLHAEKLSLTLAGKVCRWQAKLPGDLERTLDLLSKQDL
jgi:pseudouridine synthase, RluA family